MNAWLIAAAALALGLLPCLWICSAGRVVERLIALQMANLLATLMIVLLAEGFERVSLYDVALALAFLSFGSTLVFVHFLERWL